MNPLLRNIVLIILMAFLNSCVSITKGLVSLGEARLPDAIFRVKGIQENKVVLTIDDGPSVRTKEILALLDQYDSKATFFIHTDHIGTPNAPGVKDILAAGHEIANHMPCDVPTSKLYEQAFVAQFRNAHERLTEAGARPRWFRPAGGFYKDYMKALPAELGYEPGFVLGSVLPWDVSLHLPRLYAAHLGASVFPGAIVVFHDGTHTDRPGSRKGRVDRTLVSMDAFLRHLKKHGWRAVTLSGLSPKVPSGLTQLSSR